MAERLTVKVELDWHEVQALIGLYARDIQSWTAQHAPMAFPNCGLEQCVSHLVLLMAARDELQMQATEREAAANAPLKFTGFDE